MSTESESNKPPPDNVAPPDDGVPPPDEGVPPPDKEGHGRRRWLVAGLVLVGLAAALLIGYAVGENSRDDDVKSAKAQAVKANQDADSASKDAAEAEDALKKDQTQDEQAVEDITNGLEDLGNAVEQEDAKDDQAAQDAVDGATEDVQSGLKQLAGDLSERIDKALANLSAKINDAVGSQSAESPSGGAESPSGGAESPSDGGG